MAVVYFDEIEKVYEMFATSSPLSNEEASTMNVQQLVQEFNASTELEGAAWEAEKVNLEYYNNALSKRIAAANLLNGAIRQALKILNDYIAEVKAAAALAEIDVAAFDNAYVSEMENLVTTLQNEDIPNLQAKINEKKYKTVPNGQIVNGEFVPDGTTRLEEDGWAYSEEARKEFAEQIKKIETRIINIKALISKMGEYNSKCQEAISILDEAFGTVSSTFGQSVSSATHR